MRGPNMVETLCKLYIYRLQQLVPPHSSLETFVFALVQGYKTKLGPVAGVR